MSAAAYAARLKRRPMTIQDSSRNLRRSTLGVQYNALQAATGQRFDQWVDAQMALPIVPRQFCTSIKNRRLPGFPNAPVMNEYWPSNFQFLNWKLYQPEVLRTRLVYAMLEFFSVGGINGTFEGETPHPVLWDIIESEVTTGNFRSMIDKITRSQTMARWLTYWRNDKTDGVRQPDENYAREIMQLYTIGLWELNLDGTRKTQGQLDPSDPRYVLNGTEHVPTYGQSDVTNMARVFTGLTTRFTEGGVPTDADGGFGQTWHQIGRVNTYDADDQTRNYWEARLVYAPSHHEMSMSKVALQGRMNVPVGTGGDASLAAALDALAGHPSTAPFVAGRMIRLLTDSNPSPEYVARVAAVFRNDGNGQVGNLRAFFRAILLDQEAMAPVTKALTNRIPSYEEQALSLVLCHAPKLTAEGAPAADGGGTAYPGSDEFASGLIGMGAEGPLQAFCNPSVFGRWPSGYAAPGPVADSGLLSPELATLTEGNVTAMVDNSANLYSRIGNMASAQDRTDCRTDGNRVALVDRISFLITGGTAPQSFKTTVLNWLASARSSEYFNNTDEIGNTYRSVAGIFWLSPWGVSRQ